MAVEETSSSIGWFVAGLAIGAGVALLYAPQTGDETRGLIGHKAEDGKEALGETGRNLAQRALKLFERGRAITENAVELIEHGKKLARG